MDVVAAFADLFQGRTDAYGAENGGCVRGDEGRSLMASDWPDFLWRDHLEGRRPIGVYPMVQRNYDITPIDGYAPHWVVKWGCVDLDVRSTSKPVGDYDTEADAHVGADNLRRLLGAMDVSAWIERTRSNGRHVWLFADEWVHAAIMRHALIVACEAAGVPTREVNPKQESLLDGQLGNYVRLPYPSPLTAGTNTRVIIHNGAELTLQEFLDRAIPARTTYQQLASLAAAYEPPKPPVLVEFDRQVERMSKDISSKLNALGGVMLRDGPLGDDRSAFLFKMACQCRESGVTPSEAVAIVTAADTFHTRKFVERPDGVQRIEETVRKGILNMNDTGEWDYKPYRVTVSLIPPRWYRRKGMQRKIRSRRWRWIVLDNRGRRAGDGRTLTGWGARRKARALALDKCLNLRIQTNETQ